MIDPLRPPPAVAEPDNDLEFEEPKKIPEIEVYYKPIPQQPELETTTYKSIEEFTPGPVYYKPFPAAETSDPVRSFLKKKDDLPRQKPEGFFRSKIEGFQRPESVAGRSRPKPETEPKRKTSKPDFFTGFDDRNSDFGDFGSDIWDKFDHEWGQKVSK